MVLSYETAGALRASVLDLLQQTARRNGLEDALDERHRALAVAAKDQTEVVGAHTNKGIDHLEKVGTLFKERAAIEEEYAAKLRALVKRNIAKKKEDEEGSKCYTTLRAFNLVLREWDALAGQHEVIAEFLRKEAAPFVASKVAHHRQSRKHNLADLTVINNALNSAREVMAKQQKLYSKSFKEAEAAYLKYNKAEKNMDISRLDLEKAKQTALSRNDQSDESKHSYAHALQQCNEAQQRHYEIALPAVLEKFRCLDHERICDTRAALEMAIKVEKDVNVIIVNCHNDMTKAVNVIDPHADTSVFVEQFRTGYPFPPLAQFEDLGKPENVLNGGSGSENSDGSTLKRSILGGPTLGLKKEGKVVRKQSMHQKIFGSGSDTKKGDSNGDYASLPPQQRIRRIKEKLVELEKEREKRIQSREGVSKMQLAYRENPKLGNPNDCDAQLVLFTREIEVITRDMQKFKLMLDDAVAHTAPPLGSETPPSSRSESGASSHYSSGAPPRPPIPTMNGGGGGGGSANGGQRASYSEESVSSEGSRITNNNDRRDEVYDEMAMPILGTCTALFAFEGGSTEGTIIMSEGQEFLLVEKDEGDGWTRVRSLQGNNEGFVPTSYLRCKWYPE